MRLEAGESYFRLGGQPAFLFVRNLTGKDQRDFDTVLAWAATGGSRLIRVHLTHGWWGSPWIENGGGINEAWAAHWDDFFDQAAAQGLYILPVFGVWADWNNGTPDFGFNNWQYNPLNPANGGSIAAPDSLFQPDSVTQELWLAWIEGLVQRWQGRENIAGWEIFSELNLATGASTEAAVDLVDRAAAVIARADRQDRPVTASVVNVFGQDDPWADFYSIDAADFTEVHLYTARLDRELIDAVHRDLDRYGKPVMIGESGLDPYAWGTRDTDRIGIRHAIWASVVSGAMNGRSLWWEDGYAVYSDSRTRAFEFMESYAAAEQAAAAFVAGVDFSGFEPLIVQFPAGSRIWGAAIGNEDVVLGWFRDAGYESPAWTLQPLISGQSVSIVVPGSAATWRIDFYDTTTGSTLIDSATLTRSGDTITIPLPDFVDDISFKMYTEEMS